MTDSSPSAAELPLPDYAHLPIGSLQHRIRTLSREQPKMNPPSQGVPSNPSQPRPTG